MTDATVDRFVDNYLSGRKHAALRNCPVCGVDLATVAVVASVYSFEVCDCDAWDFDHLVEQLWHRECFAGRAAEGLNHDVASVAADAAIECLRAMLNDSPAVKFALSLPDLVERAQGKAWRRHAPWRDEQVATVERCVRVLRVAGRLA